MTAREKLIDICMDTLPDEHPWDGCVKQLVDALIANGVTFQPPVVPGSADCFTISEMAYNNGYARGLEEGKKPGWIPVTERLPEDDLPKGSAVKQIKVLTALKSDKGVRTVRSQMRYRMTWYNSAPWAWKCSGSEITHWMPLPEPPEVKDEGK